MADVEKIENDIDEDIREESESVSDIKSDKVADDIAEDTREETESIDDLKEALKQALYENSVLKQRAERAERERDDAHKAFLNGGKEIEKDNRDYKSIVGDLK